MEETRPTKVAFAVLGEESTQSRVREETERVIRVEFQALANAATPALYWEGQGWDGKA